MARYAKGEQIEPWVMNNDRFFDKSNAAANSSPTPTEPHGRRAGHSCGSAVCVWPSP